MNQLNPDIVARIVGAAIEEDVGTGDITTNSVIDKDREAKADIVVEEDCVIAGIPVAQLLYETLDEGGVYDWYFAALLNQHRAGHLNAQLRRQHEVVRPEECHIFCLRSFEAELHLVDGIGPIGQLDMHDVFE